MTPIYIKCVLRGAWKKKPEICSRGRILLFQGCVRIRILCLNHLGTLFIPIKNLKCIKNAENACADIQKMQYISKYVYYMWIFQFKIKFFAFLDIPDS